MRIIKNFANILVNELKSRSVSTLRHKKTAITLNLEGIELFKRGFYEQAQLKFEQAIELAPYLSDPLVNLSLVFINNGRYSKAEILLKTALSLNPTPQSHQSALNNLALIYCERKKYHKAIEHLENALKVFKADHEIYYNLGACYEEIGEWNNALHYFELSKRTQNNIKAEAGIGRIQRRDWPSKRVRQFLNSFHGFNEYNFRFCGRDHLTDYERITIEENISGTKSLFFLVGAGISYPYPSCIPMASQILRQIFHVLFKIDEPEICEFYKSKGAENENEIYNRVGSDLMRIEESTNSILPFEATFQALYECFGLPVLRFVDLLKIGRPNLHHTMLAYALNKGHTVITTNFDKQIERAFEICFPDKTLHILITDKDFQDALDGNYSEGVLAKIHGDLDDLNSLALTMKGVAVTCDTTISIGDEIDPEKGWKQFEQINPRTTLSIPKALFLQKMLQEKSMIVLGYSGSDVFDIMPIITSSEFDSRGVWIEHQSSSIPHSSEIIKWRNNGDQRIILQPESNERDVDITSEVSRFFLGLFGGRWDEDLHINNSVKDDFNSLKELLSVKFKSWIERLRIDRGDGLFTLAKLYSKIGKWKDARNLYERALKIYEGNLSYDERRWLVTKINVGYIAGSLNEREKALRIGEEVKEYLETNKKENSYPNLYANILMNISVELMNTNRDSEVDQFLEKAIFFARKVDDKETLSYILRVFAGRLLKQKKYKEALEFYQIVHHWQTHVFADLREACIASMNSGICFGHLGNEHQANHMFLLAEKYAAHLRNEELIEEVHSHQAYIHNLIRGKSKAENYFNKLSEDAFGHVSKADEDALHEIINYMGTQRYDKCLALIDKLLKKYHEDKVQAFLLFIKSNVYHRIGKFEEEIEEILKFQRIQPRHPLAEHNLAITYMLLENYDLAEQHYLRAIQFMNGDYPLAECNLGILYTKMKRLEKAEEQLRKAEKLNAPEGSLNELRRSCLELK